MVLARIGSPDEEDISIRAQSDPVPQCRHRSLVAAGEKVIRHSVRNDRDVFSGNAVEFPQFSRGKLRHGDDFSRAPRRALRLE